MFPKYLLITFMIGLYIIQHKIKYTAFPLSSRCLYYHLSEKKPQIQNNSEKAIERTLIIVYDTAMWRTGKSMSVTVN